MITRYMYTHGAVYDILVLLFLILNYLQCNSDRVVGIYDGGIDHI